jgi:hypothetical protein
MPKGKKFDAAEKHFEKVKLSYEKRLRVSQEQATSLSKQLMEANNTIRSLESENTQLKDWIERLLQYTELSKEDIQKACQNDIDKNKSRAMAYSIMSFLTPYM